MHDHSLKISIIVPIYGTEKYIAQCAISLFKQTYENIEYIFVNDCTKDNSVIILQNILENYPKRKPHVKIINHKYNQGLASARLTGLKIATGDYIWCVDSDDYVETNAIEICYSYIKKNYDLIGFNYFRKTKSGISKHPIKSLTIEHALYNYISPSIWKYIVHRSLYFDYQIMPVPGINYAEDYLLTARLILVAKKKILLNEKYLYYYNCTNANSYMNNIKISSLENKADAIIIIKNFYKQMKADKRYRTALSISMAYAYLALKKVDNNNPKLSLLEKEIFQSNLSVYIIIRIFSKYKFCKNFINSYRATINRLFKNR